MAAVLRCKECFYKYRRDFRLLELPCLESFCNHARGMVYITWNSSTSMLETAPGTMRQLPLHMPKGMRKVDLCIPERRTCLGDMCIYAHSQWECTEWNKLLGRQHVIQNTNADLPNHLLPTMNQIQAEYAASRLTFEERVKGDLDISVVKVDLTRRNYKEKLHNLICWEEKRHIEILQEKCDGIYTLELYEATSTVRCGHLEGLNGDQIAYAIQASECAFVVEPNRPAEKGRFEIQVEVVIDDRNYLNGKLSIRFLENSRNTKAFRYIFRLKELPRRRCIFKNVRIEFEVKHSYFNQLILSVRRITDDTIARLLPTPNDFIPCKPFEKPAHQFFTSASEKDQLSALQVIMSTLPGTPPTIINGSFGTGKTRLLAIAAQCLIEEGQKKSKPVRVLLCAHHQVSSNHIIELYLGPMNAKQAGVEIVRLVSKRVTIKTCFDKYIEDIKHLYRNRPMYIVVTTTFLTSPSLTRVFGQGFFTHILLDESSQTREPEVIAPLCLASKETKIVLAGDACQVGPSLLVLGHEARSYGLKDSLLERLQKLYCKMGSKANNYMLSLNVNYRCHENIMCIPNQLFYGNSILPNPQDAPTHPLAPFPLIFVCSSLTHKANCESETRLLLDEASKYIKCSNWPSTWGPHNLKKICIATATMNQLILMRRNSGDLKNANMLTSYSIQGQEFQALFMSTTEPVDASGNTTNPTKSPCDPYVFNTVLTRSKSLVVVVGSPLALLKIEEHMVKIYGDKARCWSNYLKQCINNKTFYIPDSIAKSEDQEVFKAEILRKKPSPATPISPPKVTPKANNMSSQLDNPIGHDEDDLDSSTIRPKMASSKLTVENYKERFHSLLDMEEKEHEKQLTVRCLNKEFEITLGYDVEPYGLEFYSARNKGYVMYGFISSNDKDTLAHVKQASEKSVITLENGSHVHCSHVYAKEQDICIGLQAEDAKVFLAWSKFDSKITFKADVKFELKHAYFGRLHEAINQISSEVVKKLIPSSKMLNRCICSVKAYRNNTFQHAEYSFLDLDNMQLEALNYILNSPTSVPLLVAGPFGTGKTRLLARAAYELLYRGNRRVLICAHHQASADTFMEYFGEMKNDPKNPWRFKVMRVTPNKSYKIKNRKFERYYVERRVVPPNCDLIVTTLGTAPYLNLKRGYFTDILIDEGAQTREPETIGPLCYADEHTRIIIAGDHCQVGPRSLKSLQE